MSNKHPIADVSCWCRSHAYKLVTQGVYNRQVSQYPYELHECLQCGTNRVYPVPSVALYTDGYQASTDGSTYVEREKPWCKDLADEIVKLVRAQPELGWSPVLDVGCNGGELVEEIQNRGLIARGCDVDKVAVDFGKQKGRDLFLKDLSEEKLNETHGIIMLNHTLEHIVPAAQFLENLISGLKPNGLLLIHVPNHGSWISKVMGNSWGFLAPHEHVWNFTPKTLENLVLTSGAGKLETVSIKATTALEPYDGTGMKVKIKKMIILLSRIFNQGDEIVAVFRKV